MEKKEINKKRINIILYTLGIVYLFALFLSHSYYDSKRGESESVMGIKDVQDLKINVKEIESNMLEILPVNYEEIVSINNLNLTQRHISYLLNYGYVFLEEDSEGKEIIDMYTDILPFEIYNNLTERNSSIYISSQIISHYFISKFEEIQNFPIEDSLKKNLKRKLIDIETNFLLLGDDIKYLPFIEKELVENILRYDDVEIIVENDIENYQSIKNQLENISKHFPQYNILKDDIDLIISYTEKKSNNENISKEKGSLVNLLSKIPTLKINKEEDAFGYLLIEQNNMLYISPYVLSSDESEKLSLENIKDDNFLDDFDVAYTEQQAGTIRIPVLMYHHISNYPEGSSEFRQTLHVTPEMFEKQIAYLTRKNYKSISTDEFYNLLSLSQNPKQKTVLITFDDSLLTHYTQAYPILRKYGHSGTFFVPSKVGLMPSEQLREMSDNGMDIQSHSATHPDLSKVNSMDVLSREIVESKKDIENITGKVVNSFAYPGCVGNRPTFNMVLNTGYQLGFSCGPTIDHEYPKHLTVARRLIPNDMNQFIRILSGF